LKLAALPVPFALPVGPAPANVVIFAVTVSVG
jgi:hypothetical protein